MVGFIVVAFLAENTTKCYTTYVAVKVFIFLKTLKPEILSYAYQVLILSRLLYVRQRDESHFLCEEGKNMIRIRLVPDLQCKES